VVKLPFGLAERKRANGEHERRPGELGLRREDVESDLRQLQPASIAFLALGGRDMPDAV
jgi:hypothetical protein